MTSMDIELKQQLKDAGRRLLHPPYSVDELLYLLNQVEKHLSRVDQSPDGSMIEALDPSRKALVGEGLLKHSDIDVKVAVASCISEITRITAPEAPYNDDQMRNVFELIVSSFENLCEKSSQSYNKRVSVLETVAKVRSCLIMLDLECDGLIVEMFEHFLKSIRDHHPESIFSSMTNIMVLVLEESEDITLDMLKPLLARVRNNSEGVLPVARKLGEGVLKMSADKLRPFLTQALRSLDDSLDNYSEVVASVCKGPDAAVEHNDENVSCPQQSEESNLAKGSSDQAPQADESKLTTASSDDVPQVVKENPEEPVPEKIDPTPKPVMSNGIRMAANKDASADDESSKKVAETVSQPEFNRTSKVDADVPVAEKLGKAELKPEQTTKRRGKKSGSTINSAEPSDSSHVDGEKEAEKLSDNRSSKDVHNSPDEESSKKAAETVNQPESKVDADVSVAEKLGKAELKPEQTTKRSGKKSVNTINSSEPSDSSHVDGEKEAEKLSDNRSSKDAHNSPAKEPSVEALIPLEIEKDTDIPISSPKARDSQAANASSSQSGNLPDVTFEKAGLSKKKQVLPQEEEAEVTNTSLAHESPSKKAGQSKNKGLSQEDAPSRKEAEGAGDLDIRPQRRSRKKAPVAKQEDKLPVTIPTLEDDEATSGSDDRLIKSSSKKVNGGNSGSKSAKQSGKIMGAGDSKGKKTKQSGKKMGAGESKAKKPKQVAKKVNAGDAVGKPANQSLVEDNESDSDATPRGKFGSKGEKSVIETKSGRHTTKEEEGSDSETKSLKLSAKKGNASKSAEVKSSSKKEKVGKKPARGKTISERDQVKTLFEDDEMDISPKSQTKSAKGKGNLAVTPAPTSKRKRTATKAISTPSSKISETICYDESLVGLKVKVYWPQDKMFYEGVIDSFYSSKGKHKVLYLDGEEEILNLRRQRWEILKEFSGPDEVLETETESVVASPEIHKKKKSKTDSEPSTAQEKTKGSAKRAGGSSSKGSTSKSGHTSKGDNTNVKSKDEDDETPQMQPDSKSNKVNANDVKSTKGKRKRRRRRRRRW